RVPFSFPALGVCMLMVSVCNALGMSLRALAISLLRLFGCFLPALWLGAQWGGVSGLLSGVVFGNLMAGVMAWWLYRQGMSYMTRHSPLVGA
ncbi:MAG: MATE family efflux transporter, partial [Natronospirillum sp.]